MLDDQIGSYDHARKKFKIIGPFHSYISLNFKFGARNVARQPQPCPTALFAKFYSDQEISRWAGSMI